MSRLVLESSEAVTWVREEEARQSEKPQYGSFCHVVIWRDARDETGRLVVDLRPEVLVNDINTTPWRLLHGHDPGRPIGRVLAARFFTSAAGDYFVAGLLGFYHNGKVLSFTEVGTASPMSESADVEALTGQEETWIDLAIDPREVGEAWIEAASSAAPVPLRRIDVSHNAQDPLHELVIVALPYAAILWNPFVKAFGEEAGKSAFAALHHWLSNSIIASCRRWTKPVVDIQGRCSDCQVSFLIRGHDTKQHLAAHQGLADAAKQASELVETMRISGRAPDRLIYEYDPELNRWIPSFAELADGTLVTDQPMLVAMENLPEGLSIGFCPSDHLDSPDSQKQIAG